MMIHEAISSGDKVKHGRRCGRGRGSGLGKTCGRGHKGYGARSGSGIRPGYEGGQMPIFRRLPKRGFSNFNFRTNYAVVNVNQLDRFDAGSTVDAALMAEAGLIRSPRDKVRLLGTGDLGKRLTIKVHGVSKTASEKVAAAGGAVELLQ